MDRTDQPTTEHTPTTIGTPEEQTTHRDPAPTVAEHNATMAKRPNDLVGRQ